MWSNISTSSSPARVSQQSTNHEQDACIERHEGQDKEASGDGLKRRYGSPLIRYKHAVCAAQSSGYIYIHGGRFGNLPLDDDVWRFDPHQNSWIQLQTTGCKPPSLQEHSLVEYADRLYLFGGQISAPSNENSFWCLDLGSHQWRSLSMKSSSRYGAYLGPTNRRGHTAVLYGHSMYIYGGYEDFRGSSGQLWEYDLLNERWELRNLSATSSCHPEPRHSHSAVVCQDSMYIYGGLSNLKSLGDLWRWSWRDRRWYRERTRGSSPGQLHGHTAIQAFGSMFVFGGERQGGRTTRGLWRLNLSNMTWQKIRPKGPRPNPTTWHGAIANPLGILDEANYIIEGDPELRMELKRNAEQLDSSNCRLSITCDNSTNNNEQPCRLAHSKSTNAGPTESMLVNAARIDRSTSGKQQRKSRLSFLRKSHHQRPKSIHELKQIRQSLSASNFKRDKQQPQSNNRHSVTVIKREACDQNSNPATIATNGAGGASMDYEQTAAASNVNAGILDSLDTDIKEMFNRALSPSKQLSSCNSNSLQQATKSTDEPPMAMSLAADASSRSHYVTAPIENTLNSSAGMLRSQRTSYASYATTPSEMQDETLRDPITNSQIHQEAEEQQQTRRRALLAGGGGGSTPSGYDRRDNRPRSEIVQSLIDRADARIKHLYTPYFNNSGSSSNQQAPADKLFRQKSSSNSGKRTGQSFLDKSKRHTIHQTMTYYNLYYNSEESSKSSSGDSATKEAAGEPAAAAEPPAVDETAMTDIDDFGSSSTMKGVEQERSHKRITTSAALVGVHQDQPAARLHSRDQSDAGSTSTEVAAPTNNSSESRTLCQDSATMTNGQLEPSFQNALTGRRDTTSGESNDNTSLSFSVIAEFEEDDMLQYSSPVTQVHHHHATSIGTNHSRSFDYGDDDVNGDGDDDDTEVFKPQATATATNRVETILMCEPEDQLQTMILTDHSGSSRIAEQAVNKSSSSGYDSIASRGHETPSQQEIMANNFRLNSMESSAAANGDSSMRTTESVASSMATGGGDGLSSSTTIDTTTSPEQSAMKKLRGKWTAHSNGAHAAVGEQQAVQHQLSLSAASQSGLSMDQDSSMAAITGDPFKSLSPVQAVARQTQRKMPLMSRSRFFGRSSSKSRYWQLCMFVIGGKQGQGSQGNNEPITVWRLYI